MNENLFDRVSVKNLEALIDALSGVMSEMRSIEEKEENRYRDDAYCAGLTFSNMVFASFKRRMEKTTGK